MFVVVIFTEESEVEVVPMKWMVGKSHCLWPPFKASQVRQAVKSSKDPDNTFYKYPCRVLYQCDSYEKAVRKCKMAETTSDLQTDVETTKEKRNRRPTFRYLESDTDSDSDCTPSKQRKEPVMPPPAPVPPPVPVQPPTPLPPPIQLPRRDLFPDSPGTSRPQTSRSKRAEEKMLQLLEETREQNRTTQKMLTLILRKLSSTPNECRDELPDGVNFPVESSQELAALEEKLADQTMKEKLFAYLSSIGGSSIPDAVRRVMKHVIGHILATKYNWVGKGGKKAAFGSLAIKDVMIRAVRKNIPSATNAEIEPVMKDWLRYAKDRQGGRNNRRNK